MQPSNPPAQPAVPPPAAAPPKPKNRRVRLIVALAGGIMALLCLGGVGVFVSFYDEATKIERKAPDAVVDSFLRAYLVNRDDQEASLYTCKSGLDLSRLEAFRTDIQSREQRFSIGIRADWTSLTVSSDNGKTTVTTDIRRMISDGSERTTDRWQFPMIDDDGWRVCGALPVA
ncbi:hypothetical protein GCM10010435_86140 [Winogradskya consettensis]|uniref:Uncharacterized protein n=1 Tax=Winogradskya consettensis TaxID=113560 RepID=A0A919SK44_9ACTN|nr:hypothetical protein [Actinoplanes consettensis]GIM72428.1 hypothetical protein Aco04nite_30250 [Actinoplanes consettensis]